MNNESGNNTKNWKQIIAYPFHLCFRFVARFLLLLGVLVTVLLPTGIIIYIFTQIGIPSTWIAEWISENNTALEIISLLSGIGIFSYLSKKYWTTIRESLSNIEKKVEEVISGVWLPELDIKESLSVTWQHNFKSILPFMKEIITDSLKLGLAVFISCISYFFASPATTNFVYVNVKQTLTNVWNEIAPQNVIVLNSRDFSPSYLFEEGAQFSLAYASQGSLSTKTGICPEGSNEDWLELFKKAIWKCSKDERVRLRVQGFASVAPVVLDSAKSDTLNYQIANQRAEALIYFLMLPTDSIYTKTKCKDVLDNSSIWERKKENGTRVKPDSPWWKAWGVTVSTKNKNQNGESKSRLRHTFAVSDSDTNQKGKGFDVIYEPWQSYGQMKNKKPADDGSRDSLRYQQLEFLNRTVQIIIEEGGCLRNANSDSQKEEDNAEESD